jgi:hypothetical protein
LKYRLYEIDRIISRTLAYALATGLLVGVYAGLVLLATDVLALASPVAVAASTLVAAALFSPLLHRPRQARPGPAPPDQLLQISRYPGLFTTSGHNTKCRCSIKRQSTRRLSPQLLSTTY